MVRWRGWNEYDHRADLNNLCRAVGVGHVRLDKQRFGVARGRKQDTRSEGQARQTREEPEKGSGEAFEELSSTGEEVASSKVTRNNSVVRGRCDRPTDSPDRVHVDLDKGLRMRALKLVNT